MQALRLLRLMDSCLNRLEEKCSSASPILFLVTSTDTFPHQISYSGSLLLFGKHVRKVVFQIAAFFPPSPMAEETCTFFAEYPTHNF